VRRLERESRETPRLPWLQDEASSPASDGTVVEEVTAWRAERDLQRRRMAMAKTFLVLTERVHRCRKRKELLDTLAELAHEVLESSTTLLYLREASTPHEGSDSGRLAPHPTPELRARRLILEPLPTEAMEGRGAGARGSPGCNAWHGSGIRRCGAPWRGGTPRCAGAPPGPCLRRRGLLLPPEHRPNCRGAPRQGPLRDQVADAPWPKRPGRRGESGWARPRRPYS